MSALDSDFNLDSSLFTEEERHTGTGFNFGTPRMVDVDLRHAELHGLGAFAIDGDVVYHTYSCYDRGTDVLNGTWHLLDRAPMGRGAGFKECPAAAPRSNPPMQSRPIVIAHIGALR